MNDEAVCKAAPGFARICSKIYIGQQERVQKPKISEETEVVEYSV